MVKVCLVSPPSRSINHYRPPIALLYLSGYLEKNGIDVSIIDAILDQQIRDEDFKRSIGEKLIKIENIIIDTIEKINPDIVGITCYTPEFFEVLNIAKRIKKINKKIYIVVGGIHPTLYPQDFIFKNSPFDFVVPGEGEVTLLELVQSIENVSKWKKIKSIVYLDNESQKMVITPKRPLMENLDELANPAYHLVNMDYYLTANPYAIRGVFTRCAYILSSRGCPSQCTFCVSKKIREVNGSNICARLRSPRHLIQEIKGLKDKYLIDSFYFIDDLFTINKKQVNEFCQLLMNSGIGLIWGCSSKVTTVDFETLKAMKNAGCVQIDFGVERGSDQALALIKKGITVKVVKKVFSHCRKLGIRTFANMLVNLPGETEKDLDDILRLLDNIKPTIVSFNVFTPYPGTEIFEKDNHGITKKDYSDLSKNPLELIKKDSKKYKYSSHNLALDAWVEKNSKKYNRILPAIAFYFSRRYLQNIFFSKRKYNYIEMFGLLVKEFFIQKF